MISGRSLKKRRPERDGTLLFTALTLLIAASCNNHSVSNLKGTWESTNLLQPQTRYIFYTDSLRMYSHAWDRLSPDAVTAFDSIEMKSNKNLFYYTLSEDTVFYRCAQKGDCGPYKDWRVIIRLTEDSLILGSRIDSVTLVKVK